MNCDDLGVLLWLKIFVLVTTQNKLNTHVSEYIYALKCNGKILNLPM